MSHNELIDDYHRQLNHPDLVPGQFYRRNHVHYALVCYINNIIGLYLCGRFDGIPLFLARAAHHLEQHGMSTQEEYNSLVSAYLRHMARFITAQPTISLEAKGRIPLSLLTDDPE
jgi:hypothetical protein